MTSTFKYHSQVDEVVPWQATYSFPTQATKVNKQTVKLVPKNGSTFNSGNIIRIEFPADNYLNVLNSVLQFDAQWNISNSAALGVYYGVVSVTEATSTPYSVQISGWSSAVGTLATTSGDYAGYTLIVQNAQGTFSTVIAAHTYAATPLTTLTFATPLPEEIKDNDVVTIVPPYYLQRGGAQNYIKRLRVLYGSLVLEDIMEYKTLVRIFTEAGVDFSAAFGAQNILEGMYTSQVTNDQVNGVYTDAQTTSAWSKLHSIAAGSAGSEEETVARFQASNGPVTAQFLSQLQCAPPVLASGAIAGLTATGASPNVGRYTYCINLLSGLFTQKKLIPLKWMAAQLAIEITLATEADCVLTNSTANTLSYALNNVNFIAEMLEFDSAYDDGFLQGLRSGGVPIKFDTFHYHSFSMSGTYNVLQIHERARSVKAAYAVVRDSGALSTLSDSDRLFFALRESYNAGTLDNAGMGQIQQFQWRVGGRYYPAQPVRTIYGGAEALIELQKALDMLGDYTRQGLICAKRWTRQGGSFIMAAPFENTDVFPDTIAGINAEEQSDIALFITSDNTGGATPTNKRLEVFMHYDCLMIVRNGNVVDLVL